MRQDQFEKLQELSEKLTDVFLAEADPDHWPGAGISPGQMDAQTRGDRYWTKKNAVATIALVQRVGNLTQRIQLASAGGDGSAEQVKDDEESSLDAQVSAAEKEAVKLLDAVQSRARKAEFDKSVHGKK
jgi:hypothetical protein